ncbi:MAG: GvpL/GvpF family gas vesicle protein [Acidobacteria bacterium]|nr:GvpL/GvpF family gas vesicle protein [Acidobacteriota bacterium]
MKYLPYCIFLDLGRSLGEPPPGIGGQPILVVTEAGLAAAVSPVAGLGAAPDIACLTAFSNAIEWFHRFQDVLPIRYGCVLQDRPQVRTMLRERNEQYRALLAQLNSAVEMAVRLLPGAASAGGPRSPSPGASGPGTAYLGSRRRHYAAAEEAARKLDGLADRLCSLLSGKFLQSRKEIPDRGNGPVSLYFLVKRGSVDSFREAVRGIRGTLPATLLLTGPWPPYNFVDLSRTANTPAPVREQSE